MRRGFKSWSEKQALNARVQLGLPNDTALPARLLAEHMGIEVVTPEAVPDFSSNLTRILRSAKDWSAVTVHCEQQRLIVYNSAHSPARQESDLMHELGHSLCEHQPAQILRNHLCARTCDGAVEEEANWLGGCLQIPRIALLSLVRARYSNAEIAERFGASIPMVEFRRRVTGVDHQLKNRGRYST